jgi:hypothetical protein
MSKRRFRPFVDFLERKIPLDGTLGWTPLDDPPPPYDPTLPSNPGNPIPPSPSNPGGPSGPA